ncbi:MAG: phage terminase large subunit family protein [Verrucomicrobiaceae bacterium]|nr:phage terminase large subunit family protein [Verrucomicrobiaceae bacterium]
MDRRPRRHSPGHRQPESRAARYQPHALLAGHLRSLLEQKDALPHLACSARVGKTLFCICCVLHKKAVWPGPVLWVDPTGKTAKAFSRTELQPHIMECLPVADKAIIDKTHWTTLLMHFVGSVLRLVGGGSVADLAGYQAELVVLNETDKTKHNLKGEAATQDLAAARTKQFRFTRKIIENSTPTTEWGRICSRFKAGKQFYIYVPCPHCGHKQRLEFFAEEKEVPFDEHGKPLPAGTKRVEKTGRFKFDHLKREDGSYDLERVEHETVYECAACQKDIDQAHQAWMLRRYELRAHNPSAPDDHPSVQVWAAHSPFEGWGMIAKEFLLARGSISRMHNFVNSTLGRPFVRKATDIKIDDIDAMIARSPEYLLREIPRKPEFLTMCVDVQGDGFWWTIRAWGLCYDQPELPIWAATIDYGAAVSWKQIEEIAGIEPDHNGKYNHYTFDGQPYVVFAGLIDSGFEAQSNKKVYAFTLRHADVFSPSKGGGWQQLRGMDVRTSPVNDDQQELVWYYDDGFKQKLYYNCIKEHSVLRWLPRNIGPDYKAQLTAERTQEQLQPNGEAKLIWIVEGEQGNHLGDTEKMHEVLAEAAIEDKLAEIREKYFEEHGRAGIASEDEDEDDET